ncbi:MAG: hypothetical protein KKA73_07880 [Chloroflexi bacterium]|nr:hypothetical protein [Chloroflexota bacterium]MBU1747592.1 hypothetical protein [Chloroflexota bacterium]
MTVTTFVAQHDVIDAASGEIVVEQGQVVDLGQLREIGRRILGREVPAGEARFANRLFQRLTFPSQAAGDAATHLVAGVRYTDQPGEPVCVITARAIEAQNGGFDVKLHDQDEIYISTGRRREHWATIEAMADWVCLETGADYCLLTVRYRHGGELTGLGWWPVMIGKTPCKPFCRCPAATEA